MKLNPRVEQLEQSFRRNRTLVLMYVALAILSLPFVYRFWWMITSSFKPFEDIFAYPAPLLPTTLVFDNAARMASSNRIFRPTCVTAELCITTQCEHRQ